MDKGELLKNLQRMITEASDKPKVTKVVIDIENNDFWRKGAEFVTIPTEKGWEYAKLMREVIDSGIRSRRIIVENAPMAQYPEPTPEMIIEAEGRSLDSGLFYILFPVGVDAKSELSNLKTVVLSHKIGVAHGGV